MFIICQKPFHTEAQRHRGREAQQKYQLKLILGNADFNYTDSNKRKKESAKIRQIRENPRSIAFKLSKSAFHKSLRKTKISK